MKKQEQLEINEKVEKIMDELYEASRICLQSWTRLRTCNAEVGNVGCFYVLKSYGTIVACIDKRTDTCYDFLRNVYGYTATSAQHIAKFRKDYGAGKWGCAECLTWREV